MPRISGCALLGTALFGCKEGRIEGKAPETSVEVSIVSPAEGDVFAAGEQVLLSARATDQDDVVQVIESAEWSAPDWATTGNDVVAVDLPLGTYDLDLAALVAGETLTDSVSITVAIDDTGEPLPDVAYEGIIAANVFYEGSYGKMEDPCDGWVTFTITGEGALSGEGNCRAFGEDWQFSIAGTRDEDSLSGELSMEFKKITVPTDWRGTIDDKGHVEGAFDQTHVPKAGETIRVWGTFTADPAEK